MYECRVIVFIYSIYVCPFLDKYLDNSLFACSGKECTKESCIYAVISMCMRDCTIIVAVEGSIYQWGSAVLPSCVNVSTIFNQRSYYTFWSCNSIKLITFKGSSIFTVIVCKACTIWLLYIVPPHLFQLQSVMPNFHFRQFCLDRHHFSVAAELHFHFLILQNDIKDMRINFDGY